MVALTNHETKETWNAEYYRHDHQTQSKSFEFG